METSATKKRVILSDEIMADLMKIIVIDGPMDAGITNKILHCMLRRLDVYTSTDEVMEAMSDFGCGVIKSFKIAEEVRFSLTYNGTGCDYTVELVEVTSETGEVMYVVNTITN
jgi:hypothetical protein